MPMPERERERERERESGARLTGLASVFSGFSFEKTKRVKYT